MPSNSGVRSARGALVSEDANGAARAEVVSATAVSQLASSPINSRRLSADDLFALQYIRGGCLSPNGRSVAYAVSRTEEREHFQIWVAEIATGERRPLGYSGNAGAPAWSPDGNRIAFIGDGRLRLAEFPSLSIREPLTPIEHSIEGRISWSPDGKRLAVSLSRRCAVEGPRRLVEGVFRVDGMGFLDHFTQRIYAITIEDGALRCLTGEDQYCSQPEWSPCGHRLLFLARRAVIAFATGSQRLCILDLADGAVRELLGKGWYLEAARWVPGGDRIVVAGAKDSLLSIPSPSLWVIDARSGDAQIRTPGLLAHVGFRLNHDMPARELAANNALVVPNRQSAFVSIQTRGNVEIWRVSLEGAVAVTPVVRGERACIVLDAKVDADELLFATTDLDRPFELARSRLDGSREARLTKMNDAELARWPALKVEPFSFASVDGLTIDAWFMSTVDRQTPMPTVLFIHAGPYMGTGNAFRYDFHHLASHGYGVLFANFRGSVGYGEAFTRAIAGDWGARTFPDHMAAVDAAISRGYADPDRLGVWGPSHGGFAACWVVGHTNRFRAAVAEAAITNFATLYYLTDVPETFASELGGRPHEIPDVFRSRSPLTYAHRCVTPTLLVHGEEDLRCPIGEAEQFYRALQDVGCLTELVRIPACSHIGDSIGPLSARRAQNEALLNWFDRHL